MSAYALFSFILSAISVAIGVFAMSDVKDSSPMPRRRNVVTALIYTLSVICLWLAVFEVFRRNGIDTRYVNRVAVILCLTAYAVFISKARTYKKITIICVFYTMPFIVRNIRTLLMLQTDFVLEHSTILSAAGIIIYTAVLILVYRFIRKYSISKQGISQKLFLVSISITLLIYVLCGITLDVLWESGTIGDMDVKLLDNLLTYLIITAFSLVAYYLIYTLSAYYSRKEELTLLRQKQDEAMAEVAHANQMYEEMRVLRHEFKNNILAIRGLAGTKQYDKLDQYLNNYLKTDGMALGYIDCGNKVLNNILNYKYSDLTSKGVAFNYYVSVPEELPYEESDITSLLVNLIDNAAEAARKTDAPSVTMNVIVEKGYCFVTVVNPVNTDILNENPTLQTTKKDKKRHGIGLKVVRNIVEKYDGYFSFEQKGGEFIASAMLSID